MSDEFVLRDDVSRYGLRRVHVMRNGKPVDREAWTCQVLAEGGTIEETAEWHLEDLDIWHFYLVWRNMNEAMLVYTIEGAQEVGDLIGSIGRAWERYVLRTGKAPNRAIVREGTALPQLPRVEMRDQNGKTVSVVEIATVKWLQSGAVGVYLEEKNGRQHSI